MVFCSSKRIPRHQILHHAPDVTHDMLMFLAEVLSDFQGDDSRLSPMTSSSGTIKAGAAVVGLGSAWWASKDL